MISCQDGRFRVEGPITMQDVTGLLAESARLFTAPEVIVDLSGVTEVDSSAVSLLLEWRREAAKVQRRLEFRGLPQSLVTLAELYGVSHLIAAQ